MIKKVIIDKANRIFQMPPDLLSFTQDNKKKPFVKKSELIDLGRFNWPVEMAKAFIPDENGFKPAGREKIEALKAVVSDWFFKYHKVKINPSQEIFIGGRISSIILNTAFAFIDHGDIVFTPELGLPLYKKAVTACGGETVNYAISFKNNWQPEFDRINTRLGRVARLLFLNTPHNPTGTVLDENGLTNLVWLAGRENIAIVNDAAYQSINDRMPLSLLSVPGGKKVGIEIYSFAYQFGLPALPFGFAIGNKEIISGLEQVSYLNQSYIPEYYIDMAQHAIRHFPNEELKAVRKQLQNSTGAALKFLDQLNLEQYGQTTIPFIWAKIEKRRDSNVLANQLYRKYRILTIPGSAFGDSGEGFLRLSLTASPEAFEIASQKTKKGLRLRKKDILS